MTLTSNSYSERIITEQLGLYTSQTRWLQRQSANPEAHSQQPYDRAAAVELTAVIGLGLNVYDAVNEADIRWSESTQEGATKEIGNDAQRVDSWYTEWLTTSEMALEVVAVLEKAGFSVINSLKLRDACAAIRTEMSIPSDRVAKAVENLNAVRFKSMETIRGELRRKMVAGG